MAHIATALMIIHVFTVHLVLYTLIKSKEGNIHSSTYWRGIEQCLQDPNNALCHQGIMQPLLNTIEDVNPYAHAYRYMTRVELCYGVQVFQPTQNN